MIDTHTVLSALRRPKILIRAAKLGMANYNRDQDLRFIARLSSTPPEGAAIETLLSRENDLEESRKHGRAEYSIQEHIRVLTALLAEARLPQLLRKHLSIVG
jgi:hypothetical protein